MDLTHMNGTAMVRVLDERPDLGCQLAGRAHQLARTQALAPVLNLPAGPQTWSIEGLRLPGHLGFLVLGGLIARHVNFGQIGSSEFVGPGDLIRPWSAPQRFGATGIRWEILTPARLAVLDRDFAVRARHWPEITAAVLEAAVDRVHSQLLQSAIRQAKRVDDRVLLALWHFASRWGRVSSQGAVIRLPGLTGDVLASIVGARRQSVSTALGALQSRGALRRLGDGSWLIPEAPSQLDHLEVGERASDREVSVGPVDP